MPKYREQQKKSLHYIFPGKIHDYACEGADTSWIYEHDHRKNNTSTISSLQVSTITAPLTTALEWVICFESNYQTWA